MTKTATVSLFEILNLAFGIYLIFGYWYLLFKLALKHPLFFLSLKGEKRVGRLEFRGAKRHWT